MPPAFTFPDDVDIWLRLQWDLTKHSRGAHFMEAIARLQPGVDDAQAFRELSAISARLGENVSTNRGWLATPIPLLDDMLGYYRPALRAARRRRHRPDHRASTSPACSSRARRIGRARSRFALRSARRGCA